MYGFIYETTCLVNGKKYIGKKVYDKEGHWKKYLGSGKILKRAVEKYGRENFKREILCECETAEELCEKEIEYIAKANATSDPLYYNICYGGEGGIPGENISEETKRKIGEANGKKVICVETGEVFASSVAASKTLGKSDGAVSMSIRNNQRCGGFHFKYLENYDPEEEIKDKPHYLSKPVVCVETGEVFESAASASRALGFQTNQVANNIFQGCTCRGFHFRYLEDYDPEEVFEKKPPAGSKSVVCVETGEIFESSSAASRSLGLANSAVSNSIRKKTKCGGYHWAYID